MNPSLPQVAAFIRQCMHNLRNDLTGIELEAVLLNSLFPEGEAAAIVGRIRAQIHRMSGDLHNLAAHFAEPKPVRAPLSAHEFFQALKRRFETVFPDITWTELLGEARMSVDATSLADVFHELFVNAVKFGDGSRLAVSAAVEDGLSAFSLREPKASPVDPSEWGCVPFVTTRRGSYGLGLWAADRIVRANGGSVARRFADGALTTTLLFPAG